MLLGQRRASNILLCVVKEGESGNIILDCYGVWWFFGVMLLCMYMGRTPVANRLRVEELKIEYGLSEKAARFVDIDLREPHLTTSEKARAAGYPENARVREGGKSLKTARIIKAKKGELAKMAKIAELQEVYDKDPRDFIKKQLLIGGTDETVTANQTKNFELLGKMDGLFVDRVEIDVGVQTRGRLFGNVLNIAKVSGETEDES